MKFRILTAILVSLLVGCGGGSGGSTTAGTTDGNTTDGNATDGNTTDGNATDGNTTDGNATDGNTDPTTAGVWFGAVESGGESVFVVDDESNVFGLVDLGDTTYQTVFGAINGGGSGTLELFNHRDSDDPTHGNSFTVAGDAPPVDQQFAQVALSVTNDGEQLDNSGADLPFSIAAATTSDVQAISLSDMTGSWLAETSFCSASVGCYLDLTLNITAAGVVTGNTTYNSATPFVADIDGQVSEVSSSNQYLKISFNWNGTSREGVLYQDRTTNKVVLNSSGGDGGQDANENGNRSFSAQLTKQ